MCSSVPYESYRHVEERVLKGRVVAVCRSANKGQPKQDVYSGFFERGLGLVGDAHAGTEKQVSILAKEKVDQLAKKNIVIAHV
jgi:hypothetical protein